MMMLSEVAKTLNAHMIGADVKVTNVGTDSRNIVKNQLFVGIKGDHFDGSAYAEEAIKQGAAAVLVNIKNTQATPAVVVENTRLALGKLAHYWRKKFTLPMVAVTGSNGKTTVKEMITAILTVANESVLATKGNLNNDIGMPLTLLSIGSEHAYAVIEMGMNHEGEIRYLTKLAEPTVAIVNNAGTAHIGELGSREAIARAKGEIFEGLAEEGIAVINADDDFADYWKALNQNRKTITFGLKAKAAVSASYLLNNGRSHVHLTTPNGEIQFYLNVLGEHNVHNAVAASAVAFGLGFSNADIAAGLSQFRPVKGRLNKLEGLNGVVVIDDTYNANPDSMKMAIDVLSSHKGIQIFVMGDMAELGADSLCLHAEVGLYAKQKGITQLLGFGEQSQRASDAFGENASHFESLESLVQAIKSGMKANTTVLVKGSRFMKMERVVNQIVPNKIDEGAH
ncbi:MAG: UDP-N-acetylmuramoyl-tripeptide--D-alanyl-D-alanine ligase [Methylophilaceae bacterium]